MKPKSVRALQGLCQQRFVIGQQEGGLDWKIVAACQQCSLKHDIWLHDLLFIHRGSSYQPCSNRHQYFVTYPGLNVLLGFICAKCDILQITKRLQDSKYASRQVLNLTLR